MSEKLSILQLPVEVLISIFKYLSLTDIYKVILTCKTFKELIVNDNGIWKTVCAKKLIVYNGSGNRRQVTLSSYNQCRISNNWCKGIYRSKIVLQHNVNYMPWINYINSEYLIVSVGSEIICYPTNRKGIPDCGTYQWRTVVPTVQRYDIRTNDVSRFKIRNSLLACGNRDGCLSIYLLKDLKKKPHLLHHIRDCYENGNEEITAVELLSNNHKTYAITGCDQSQHICFFNLDTEDYYNSDVRIVTLSDIVGTKCMALNKSQDKLAIGLNGSNTPIIVDVEKSRVIFQQNSYNRKRNTRDIQWHNENIVTYVTYSGTLQSLDIRSNKTVYEAEDPFQSTLYCVKTDENHAILVGSSEYSRCVLFDVRYCGRHIQMYFTQKRFSPIYSLDFDSTKLIAAADRNIAVLNFNVNSCTTQIKDYSHTFEVVR